MTRNTQLGFVVDGGGPFMVEAIARRKADAWPRYLDARGLEDKPQERQRLRRLGHRVRRVVSEMLVFGPQPDV